MGSTSTKCQRVWASLIGFYVVAMWFLYTRITSVQSTKYSVTESAHSEGRSAIYTPYHLTPGGGERVLLCFLKKFQKLNGKGVPIYIDKTMQCGDSHIFIAGDANDDIPLLHEASDEGKIAGKNAALYPNVELGQRRTHLGIVFSDPEIAIIGKSVDSFENLIVGKVSFEG